MAGEGYAQYDIPSGGSISIGASVVSAILTVLVAGIVSLIMGFRLFQWMTNVEFSRLFIIAGVMILVLTVIIKKLFK